MNQTFTCELCEASGTVRIAKHEDVWSACTKVINKHRALSPKCRGGIATIRVHSQLGIIKTQRAARKQREALNK